MKFLLLKIFLKHKLNFSYYYDNNVLLFYLKNNIIFAILKQIYESEIFSQNVKNNCILKIVRKVRVQLIHKKIEFEKCICILINQVLYSLPVAGVAEFRKKIIVTY